MKLRWKTILFYT